MSMAVTEGFQQAIRQLMREPSWDVVTEIQRLANAADALPIGIDLHVVMFIRPDGAVGGCAVGEDSVAFRESPTALITALLIGSKRMPELKSLLPERPPTASECSRCAGAGNHPLARHSYCDMCGGVGWRANAYSF